MTRLSPIAPGRAAMLAMLGGAVALLGGCSGEERREAVVEEDPAIAAALSDPIMSDPDLAGQDRSGDAVAITPSRVALPPGDEPSGASRR